MTIIRGKTGHLGSYSSTIVDAEVRFGSMKLLVVIPALNEVRSVFDVINEVRISLPSAEILVIDDGQNDGTGFVAQSAGAKVITHPNNVGVGAAIRTGFKYAFENGITHVIQIDADGQHDPKEVEKLLAKSDQVQIVIGSRFLNDKNEFEIGYIRRMAMRWLAFSLFKITKTPLSDVTSGFRVSTGPAIPLFARDFPSEYLGDTVGSLVIAHRAGLSFLEVPIQMRPRKYGKPSQGALKSLWYVGKATFVLLAALLNRKKYSFES